MLRDLRVPTRGEEAADGERERERKRERGHIWEDVAFVQAQGGRG